MLRQFLELMGIVWLCIEIGAFIENRIPILGKNSLFWPLWLSIFLILILLIYILELIFS